MVALLPYVERLKIVTKKMEVVSLRDCMNESQYRIVSTVDDALNARRRCRIVILKSRQMGTSTIVEGVMYTLAFLLENYRGLVVAHETDSSTHLLSMTDHYHDTFWARDLYPAKHRSMKHLSWDDSKSSIQIATARNIGAGRGRTIQGCHLSEMAFYDKPRELLTGLAQSIPSTSPSLIAVESTANGVGNYFYDEWHRAENGESEYIPLFFGWWEHPEYTAEAIGMSAVLNHLAPAERELRGFLRKQGLTPEEADSRIAWYRHALANLCQGDPNKRAQEYPTVAEEAFLATGNNVFPDDALTSTYIPMNGLRGFLVERANQAIEFVPSSEGPITIFRQPGPKAHSRYTIGADPTRGVKGDYACAQVINRRSWEQVAVFHGHRDPANFANDLILLGRYYNWAIICPEVQGGGEATIGALIRANYPFIWQRQKFDKMQGQVENAYGWWAGVRGKAEAVGNLLKAVIDKNNSRDFGLTIHHSLTYSEMRAFEDKGNGQYGNSSEQGHDDTVSALAIAVTVTMYEALELARGQTPYVPGQEYETPRGRARGRVSDEGPLVEMGAGLGGQKDMEELMEMDGADVDRGVPVALQQALARARADVVDDGWGEW